MVRDGLTLGLISEMMRKAEVSFFCQPSVRIQLGRHCCVCIPGELLDLDVFGFGLEPLLFLSGCFFSVDDGSGSVLMDINIELSKRLAIVVLPVAV